MVFPTNETLEESSRYDWIIHPGSITELDDAMRATGYNYIMADRNGNSEYYSDITPRIQIKNQMSKELLSVYQFTLEQN